jgi:hypothetical protein
VEELARRLLSPGALQPGAETIRLLPGAIPDGLPLPIPQPPGSRLLGSTIQGTERHTSSVTVMLDAVGSAPDLLVFYEEEFARLGFHPPPPNIAPGLPGERLFNYVPEGMVVTGYRGFCPSQVGLFLSTSVQTQPTGLSEVRVTISPTPRSCGQPPEPPVGEWPRGSFLPWLQAPPGVQLSPGGMGYGTDHAENTYRLITTLSSAAIEARFAQQLAAEGWVRQRGRDDGPVAWSQWEAGRVQSPRWGPGVWQGLLLVAQAPGENRRVLRLELRYLALPLPQVSLPTIGVTEASTGQESTVLQPPGPQPTPYTAVAQASDFHTRISVGGLTAPEGQRLLSVVDDWVIEPDDGAPWDTTALEAHFARQLAAAGWQRQAGNPAPPVSWSTWRRPTAPDPRVLLVVQEQPDDPQRRLYLRADSADAPFHPVMAQTPVPGQMPPLPTDGTGLPPSDATARRSTPTPTPPRASPAPGSRAARPTGRAITATPSAVPATATPTAIPPTASPPTPAPLTESPPPMPRVGQPGVLPVRCDEAEAADLPYAADPARDDAMLYAYRASRYSWEQTELLAIGLPSGEVRACLPTSERAPGARFAVAPDGHRLYRLTHDDFAWTLAELEAPALRVVRQTPLPAELADHGVLGPTIAVSHDGSAVYFQTARIVGPLRRDPRTDLVQPETAYAIVVYDPAQATFTHTIPLDPPWCGQATLNPLPNGRLAVYCPMAQDVRLLDPATARQLARVDLAAAAGEDPRRISAQQPRLGQIVHPNSTPQDAAARLVGGVPSSDGRHFWALFGNSRLLAVDLTDGSVAYDGPFPTATTAPDDNALAPPARRVPLPRQALLLLASPRQAVWTRDYTGLQPGQVLPFASVHAAAVSRDGSLLAITGGWTSSLVEVTTGRQLLEWGGQLEAPQIVPAP